MRDAEIDAFWKRYVTRAEGDPPSAREVAEARAQSTYPLPESFVALLSRGRVARVSAHELRVGPVGDWLAHSMARHAVLRALADTYGNPVLASLVPFGETSRGLEVALDLATARVVWLDPSRYETPGDGVVSVIAESFERYVHGHLDAPERVASR